MDRISKAIEVANKRRKDTQAGRKVFTELDLDKVRQSIVPKSVLDANKIVAGDLQNPVSEYYRLLRTKVLREMEKSNIKTIGVTGPSSDAGKSLTAANLAVAIAMEPNHSCLLIDADLRKPSVARIFGLETEQGFSELIEGKVSLGEVLVSPGIGDLHLLTNSKSQLGSSDLLMGKVTQEILDGTQSADDGLVTIFDLPPVFVGDDAVALSSKLDGVLIVVDSGKTSKEQLSSALELLKDVKVIGCVLNNAPDRECLSMQYGYY